MTNKEGAAKLLRVLFGTFLVAIGISLLVAGEYGVDTISTFLLGMMNFIPVPFWLASTIFNVFVLLLLKLVDASELGVGSLINALTLGIMLRFVGPVVAALATAVPGYSIGAAVLGPIFMGIGGAFYVSAALGSAALEALTNVLVKKTSFSIKAVRIGLDGLMVLLGLILGASAGIGTLFCVLLIGPSLELTYTLLNRSKLGEKQSIVE